jgi:Tfp pilus assembly protein PilV
MERTYRTIRTLSRRGALLTEAVVACVILGVAISMLVPALAAIGRQRQSIRFDTLAMIELNNIANVIRHQDVQPADAKISEWFTHRYSDATLNVELLQDDQNETKDHLKSLRLTIRRPLTQSMPDQAISIVVWRVKEGAAP